MRMDTTEKPFENCLKERQFSCYKLFNLFLWVTFFCFNFVLRTDEPTITRLCVCGAVSRYTQRVNSAFETSNIRMNMAGNVFVPLLCSLLFGTPAETWVPPPPKKMKLIGNKYCSSPRHCFQVMDLVSRSPRLYAAK